MQWGQNEPSPKHGLTHINFKSRSYLLSKKCCASGISLEYFWIIHFRIKAATFILHGSLCIDWLQSIQASEVLIERPKKQEGLLTNVYHNRAIQIHTHTHIYIYIIYIHDKVLYLVRHGSKWPQERSRLKSIRLLSIYEEQKTPLCPNEEVYMDDTWLLDIKFFWQILPSF